MERAIVFLVDTNILIYYLFTLVTRNTKDFKGLSVQVVDPFTTAP